MSFFMLYINSGRYFAIVCVILITPAAPVVICTKYGPAKWHSFFKDAYIMALFRTVRNRLMSFIINSKQHIVVRQRSFSKKEFGII